MAKHRRYIRLHGKLKKSPLFNNATDADRWYNEKLREKQHLQEGLPMPLDNRTTLKIYFHLTWLPRRKKEYLKSTWGSDEQRFRDYIEPNLGNMKVSKINTLQVRHCLQDCTEKHGLSIPTRNKVRSLLSKLLGDAMLEKTPLRNSNPALGIRFQDPRQGKKKPKHIAREKDIKAYLKAAKAAGHLTYAMTCTFLMSALRKSELIALAWSSLDEDANELIIRSRYVQAEGKIFDGTKAGREEERTVGIPDALVQILKSWKSRSEFQAEDDFMFPRETGECMKAHDPNRLLMSVRAASGVEASPHALRHSFGRWFVANGGNLKALQTIMGHSNYSTTEIYSDLHAEQVRKERNRVSFSLDTESGGGNDGDD